MKKKCPHCGQSLHDAALKCSRCKKWVPNELFNRLCDEDVKLIKDKDLFIITPTLLAMMVIGLLQESSSLEQGIQDMQKQQGKSLNDEQRFNLLVFESFCYFNLVLFAEKKQGCKEEVMDTLMYALLYGVAELFNSRVKCAPSSEVLIDRGKALYVKFQAIWHEPIDWEVSISSQIKVSKAFASAVLGEDSGLLLSGSRLYITFTATFEHMRKEFSKMFLVEEEDFDWQAKNWQAKIGESASL